MARPKQRILSPQLIAKAALRLVAKHGEFTIPGVAAALGVHPSSLYHHLPGGRQAIVHRMREELYADIELGPALDVTAAPLDRLRLWMRAYRAATARVPAVVPVLVGAPVEDLRTLEIYEALFVILRDAGVPAQQRVACSAMIDAVALGSAMDAGSPVPLWRIDGHQLPELREVAASNDDEQRAASGFELAIEAVVAAVAGMTTAGR
ncbi:TetR/AcrR family transcriptional regulator [Agrococcus baldri]|uniref:Tetracycline repressor, C-all-alpha domain protein n=1 Tax=Agrococcus baldri TaxID=153730 RepID=A0AA87R9N4_9MICO|nr:TetR/AcrR family transcriptional regulator C-terminal domain-containing protein [Agrococcus baldri]GEK79085.1 tetracycline repressor, C-all-alpha domain protein [Agrococcus baldri]